jgi:hypothetical protein
MDVMLRLIAAISSVSARPQLGHPDDVSADAPQLEHG